jgi:hypothetical protein
MAALSAATSILLFRLLRRAIAEPIAILAAAFWAFDPASIPSSPNQAWKMVWWPFQWSYS